MGLALMLWVLVGLLSISLTDKHPWWALAVAGVGGTIIGITFYRPLDRQTIRRSVPYSLHPVFGKVQRYEIFLIAPPLLVLLFSNRFPLKVSFFALAVLLFLWACRKVAAGCFPEGTPLDLPILLLLLSSCAGLYASIDARLSMAGVLKLLAGVGFFYGLVKSIDSDRKAENTVLLALILGMGIALAAVWVMQPAHVKLPFVGKVFDALPDLLLRWINPNYMGGTLTLFFPLAFWIFVFRRQYRVRWLAFPLAIIGLGLLLTQSRGALAGVCVALVLTGAWGYRSVRWGLPFAAGAGALLLHFFGAGIFLDPSEVGGLAGRSELWARAAYITQDFPFTGIGMHTFPVVTDLMYPLFTVGPNARVPHAHNLYLQVAVDTGIPGFAAFWMLLGAWGKMVWEALRLTGAGTEGYALRPLLLGVTGGVVAHLFYGVTDAIALGEKAGIVFWAALGMTGALWMRVQAGGATGEAAG